MNKYTVGDIQNRLNANIQGRIGMLTNPMESIDMALREVMNSTYPFSGKDTAFLMPTKLDTKHSQCMLPYNFESLGSIRDVKNILDVADVLTYEGDLDDYKALGVKAMAIVSNNEHQFLKTNFNFDNEGENLSTLNNFQNWTPTFDALNVSDINTDLIYGDSAVGFDIKKSNSDKVVLTNISAGLGDRSADFNGDKTFSVGIKLQTHEGINNFTLKIGSSDGNYYTVNSTTGEQLVDGFNNIKFVLNKNIIQGSPDLININFVEIVINKNADIQEQTNCILNGFFLSYSEYYKITYFSNTPWRTARGLKIKSPKNQDDYILSDISFFVALINKASELCGTEADIPQARIQQFEKKFTETISACPIKDELVVETKTDYSTNANNRWIQ